MMVTGLAARASQNLRHCAHVEALCEDGSAFDSGPRDAIFINAGATHLVPLWLERLREGGRLLVPLTVGLDASAIGGRHMLKVCRVEEVFAARFVSPVAIFPCSGARDAAANERLSRAYQRGHHARVCRVRRDDHTESETCWLHAEQTCLSIA